MIDERTNLPGIKWKRHSTRKGKDIAARAVGYTVLAFLIVVLGAIFSYVLGLGALGVTLKMLTTYGNPNSGGLLNSIIGTWMLVGVGLLVSVIPGVFGPLYLVSNRSNVTMTSLARIITDILTSVPSIVIGLFGFLFLVNDLRMGVSLLAGGIALGIMMLPYIMRVTEISYRNVPRDQVQNAYALGADHISVAFRIYLPQAMAGILSGIILSVSIAAGETAQLLYTAQFNSYGLPTGFLHSQVPYLTYIVWDGITVQSTQYAHTLAAVASMILLLSITTLIVISKIISRKR